MNRSSQVLAFVGMAIVGQTLAGDAPSQQRTYRWKPVAAKAAFAPRDGAGALTFNHRMWLLGGWNPDDRVHFIRRTTSEVWTSSTGADWSQAILAPWEGRHCAGYAVYDNKMWILGGDTSRGHYQTDVWNSPDGTHWQKVTDKVPWSPRVLHHTAVHHGKIWIMGGQTLPQYAPAPEVFYNDVWNTSDGVHWRQVVANAPWAPRGQIGGSAVFSNRIWILGGGTYDTLQHPQRKFYNDVWSSADGVQWQCHAKAAPWAPREFHEVAVFDNRLWVLEGWNVKSLNRNDVWYSEDGENWRELCNTPWAPRHAASVFVYDGALWVVAGNNMQSDVWRLDVRQP